MLSASLASIWIPSSESSREFGKSNGYFKRNGWVSLKRIKIADVEPLPDEVEALNEEHEYLPLEGG